MKNSKAIILAILNTLALIATITMNALAVILPINKTTGELSDQYPNLFVPTGRTFSIWSIIYILLAIFVIYQLYCAFKKPKKSKFINDIGLWFIISCLANITWIIVWHYEMIPLSMVVMLFLLVSLIMIYKKLHIGDSKESNTTKAVTQLPFSIYLGWISVATLANITVLLVYFNAFGSYGFEILWTNLAICIAAILGMVMMLFRKDIFYALVINWAIIGIILKRFETDEELIHSIFITSIVGLSLIWIIIITQLARKKVY